MSQLSLTASNANWKLNVLQFNSPMSANFNSVQVKKMQHHYPIKVSQSDLQLSVIFASIVEFENFQRFVRDHQQQAVASKKLVTLNWPERSINNWTGVIKKFQAGGQRFVYAPRAQFSVELVDSSLFKQTELAAMAANLWQAIYGAGMKDGVLAPPSVAEQTQLIQDFGSSAADPSVSTNSVLTNSGNVQQPGFGPSQVTTGN